MPDRLHSRLLFPLGGLAVLMASPAVVPAAEKAWLTDIQAAMKQAEKQNKDILMDFTGSDWCIWCTRLSKEVFNTEDFQKEVPKNFILVELDFPQDASKISAETKKQNEEWSQKLGVEGFPTIFLTDAKGLPYAQTGYQPGGAKKYLAHLDELRAVRVKRDEALAKAAKSEGVDRAKALDAALDAVGESLVLTAYVERMKEIIKLDENGAAGLKPKYQQKLNTSEVRKVTSDVQRKFTGNNFDDMMKLLGEAEAKYGREGKAKIELGMLKVKLLQSQGKSEEAAKLIDELLKDKAIEPMSKVDLSMQKVGEMTRSGRHEDAIKVLDGLIADEAVDAKIRAQLRGERGRMLAEMGKTEEAIKAFDEVLATEKDKDLKVRLLVGKAELLARAGRKDDASKTFDAAAEEAEGDDLKEQIKKYKEQVMAQAPSGEKEKEKEEEKEKKKDD